MTPDDLGAELGAMLAEADPVPELAMRAALAAIEWRDLDSELATLTSDLQPDRELEHTRGEASRLLVFRAGDLIIELEVSDAGGRLRLLGQLDPPGPATITVQSASGSVPARADSRGRFKLDAIPAEWFRVVAEYDSGRRTATEWFKPPAADPGLPD